MLLADVLGRVVTLVVQRLAPQGAYVGLDADASAVLLPKSELPEGAKEGDSIDVFVYLDSDDRPIASTSAPKLERGEVAFLKVSDVTHFGAFFDWGLMKELLVPKAEQTRDLQVGDIEPIGLYVDGSGRLAGTMRVSEMLRELGEFERDEWVVGEAWRNDPRIGIFVILERRFVGLLPSSEPNTIARGETARFRIATNLPDGKVELSLRGLPRDEVENDMKKILDGIARPESPPVGDRSSPEQIRALFGLSKKAFKRAVGTLLKTGAVALDGSGFVVRRDPATAQRAPDRRTGAARRG